MTIYRTAQKPVSQK